MEKRQDSYLMGYTLDEKVDQKTLPEISKWIKKSTEKIDAAVATVMALDRAIRNQGSDGSVYDARGILVF